MAPGPVVICGHSFGGALALEYVHRFAAKVSQLVLISWVQDNGWIEYLYKNNPGYVNPRVQFAAEFSQLNEEQAFSFEAECLSDKYFAPNKAAEGREWLANINYYPSERAAMNIYQSRLDLTHIVAKLTTPTLLIVGDADRVVNLEYSRCVAAKFLACNPKFVVIKDAGHFPFFEKPEEVTGLITRFIKANN